MDAAVMFSGGAGTSIGARMAGARVVWAANHNRVCVDVHAANFPDAANVCQDLHLFNHAAMEPHDVLLASPVCRANSRASRPARAKAATGAASLASRHNAYRALPWSVIDALEVNRPRFVVVENVPEWSDWVFFADWIRMVKRLGYKVTAQILNSAAWGVPQHRQRLFVIGTLGRSPIAVIDPVDVPAPGVREFIDWEGGEWLPFADAGGVKMRSQLERAHVQFAGQPAVINLVGHRPVYSADAPLRTATRQDQFRWVYRGRFRYPTAREAFALMGFPRDYVITADVESRRTIAWSMAGDAVSPPVMAGIVRSLMAA